MELQQESFLFRKRRFYEMKTVPQESILQDGQKSGSSDFYNFFPGFVVNFKTVRTKALEQDFRRLFSFN